MNGRNGNEEGKGRMSGGQNRKTDMTAHQENPACTAERDSGMRYMDGIDMAVGLEYAGEDEALYREILADYVDCAAQLAGTIERAVAEGDFEAYTIAVHSLKSTSKTIGALALSNMAKELEYNSRNLEWERVKTNTPKLLAAYRQICLAIAPNLDFDGQVIDRKPADIAVICALLSELEECLEEFDSVQAEKITAQLSAFEHTGESVIYLEKLSTALRRFDYKTCKEIASQWHSGYSKYPSRISNSNTSASRSNIT